MPELTHSARVIAGSLLISIYALIEYVLFISKHLFVVVVVVATVGSLSPCRMLVHKNQVLLIVKQTEFKCISLFLFIQYHYLFVKRSIFNSLENCFHFKIVEVFFAV